MLHDQNGWRGGMGAREVPCGTPGGPVLDRKPAPKPKKARLVHPASRHMYDHELELGLLSRDL